MEATTRGDTSMRPSDAVRVSASGALTFPFTCSHKRSEAAVLCSPPASRAPRTTFLRYGASACAVDGDHPATPGARQITESRPRRHLVCHPERLIEAEATGHQHHHLGLGLENALPRQVGRRKP